VNILWRYAMCRWLRVSLLTISLAACTIAYADKIGTAELDTPGLVENTEIRPAAVSVLRTLVIPWHVNYQGYLTDDLGNPMTDTLDMTFGIWDASLSGTELWSEDQTVTIENGLFNVVLGSVTPIPSGVFQTGQTRWLELTVETQTLSPRTEVTSVGYSYRSVKADSAGYSSLSDMVDNFHASAVPGASDLFPRSFADAEYVNENQTDAVTSPMILDGDIGTLDLADDAVSSAKILDSTIVRADVFRTFKAPYSDTADYARSAPATPDADWTITGNVLHPSAQYGLSLRGSNFLYGTRDSTHVNLGVSCTTGTPGFTWAYCTVGGGWRNAANDENATVSGGRDNKASDNGSTVSGGILNSATNILATVGGGQNNIASNSRSTVSGGSDNLAGGNSSVVSGGWQNSALGSGSAVGGGSYNSVTGGSSGIPAGQSDTVGGDFSVAMGYRVRLDTLADYTLAFGNNFTTSATGAVIFYSSGSPIQVGIQNTSPTHLLDVGSSGAYCDGGLWIDGSSREYKEEIAPLDLDEAASVVASLTPVTYNYKSDKEEKCVGFIAEDVPDLVATKDRKGLSPMDFVAVLTKVVQSQQDALELQQREIEALKREVELLRRR
jgi:hypothetical protein